MQRDALFATDKIEAILFFVEPNFPRRCPVLQCLQVASAVRPDVFVILSQDVGFEAIGEVVI